MTHLAVESGCFDSSQIQREVVRIALVHHFHAQVRTVDHVCPGVDDATLRIQDRLVEVEAVQVERHRADAQCREPDAHNRPRCQEEVQGAAVVEAGVLENQTTEVTVSGNDVVRLFLLTELITVVRGLAFRGLAYQRRADQGTVHGGEQRTAENTCDAQHVEGVHQDVVLGLEHDHEVESATDSQGHSVREGTLSDGVDQEDGGGGGNGRAERNADPRTHAEAIAQFPLAAHVAENADEEVKNNELIRTAVIEPLVQAGSFPDGIEVQADGVGGGNDSAGDDVVAVEQRACNGLADAVDIDGRRGDEGNDEAGGCGEQGREHQHAEPADVQAVLGGGDPATETLPQGGAFALLKGRSHVLDDCV